MQIKQKHILHREPERERERTRENRRERTTESNREPEREFAYKDLAWLTRPLLVVPEFQHFKNPVENNNNKYEYDR